MKPNLNINQESTAAQTVIDIMGSAHFQNATTITTGVPAVLKVINSYLRGGILVLGGIAAVVMTLILLLTFKVRWRLLPFFIVAVGLVWGFGLVGYFGVPLTLATIAALPILMGVGMDYAIQMHSRIEEEVVVDRAPHPVQSAARGLGPALLVVTLDAVFAFAGMWFAKVPDVRKLGSLLIIGIVAVCVCSIIATLAILGIREYKSPTKAKDFSAGRLSRLVVWLGSLSPRVAVPAAILSLLVFFSGLAVEGRLQLQTNPIQWLNPSSQAIKNVVTLKADSGSDQQIGAVVTTQHPWSQPTVDYVSTMSRALVKEFPNVLTQPTGIVNTLDELMTVPGSDFVQPDAPEVLQTYLAVTPAIQRTMATNGGHALNILFRVKVDTLSSLVPVVEALEHEHPPPGMTVAPGGISIVGVGLLQNLASARTLLTYLALLFVGIWLAIRLRSILRSLLSLIPVLIAVGGVSLFAVAFNIKLSPLTAVAGPLVVAVCTEFTSLILLRFIEERNRGYPPREAMQVTASRTGRAFMVSGMTAFAGLAVIATSPMPLLGDFGIIVALNVAVALISALVVLPPILVWADDDKRQWVSRGMLRPIPAPFEFATQTAPATPPRTFSPEGGLVSPGIPVPVSVASSGWGPGPDPVQKPETKPNRWAKRVREPVTTDAIAPVHSWLSWGEAETAPQLGNGQSPEPVAVTPEPVALAPEPVAVLPELVALAPEPVAVTPEPVALAPELVGEPVKMHQPTSISRQMAPPASVPLQLPPPSSLPAQMAPPASVPLQLPPPSSLPAQMAPPASVPLQLPPPSSLPAQMAPPASVPLQLPPPSSPKPEPVRVFEPVAVSGPIQMPEPVAVGGPMPIPSPAATSNGDAKRSRRLRRSAPKAQDATSVIRRPTPRARSGAERAHGGTHRYGADGGGEERRHALRGQRRRQGEAGEVLGEGTRESAGSRARPHEQGGPTQARGLPARRPHNAVGRPPRRSRS